VVTPERAPEGFCRMPMVVLGTPGKSPSSGQPEQQPDAETEPPQMRSTRGRSPRSRSPRSRSPRGRSPRGRSPPGRSPRRARRRARAEGKGKDKGKGKSKGKGKDKGKDESQPAGRGRNAEIVKLGGVDLAIVFGSVPVLAMQKGVPLDENAAWLLQTVTDKSEKVEKIYEEAEQHDHIVRDCLRCGMIDSKDEAWTVRLRDWKEDCIAVGTSGKRSAMLALVVALFLNDKGLSERICARKDIRQAGLTGPLETLTSTAVRLAAAQQGDGQPARG